MNIQKLSLNDIEVGDRLRAVDEDAAELIAASFREIGQQTPIQVRKRGESGKYKLVAGAHRMRAAQLAEQTHVLGTVHDLTNHQADLAEVDENLLRADLTILDRAAFLARRKEIYEALHPETAHGGDRSAGQVANFGNLNTERFTKDTAERLGVSERAVQRAIHRAKLGNEVRRLLTGTVFANKGAELDALLELATEEDRIAAVNLVLAANDDRPGTLRLAVNRVRGIKEEVLHPDERLFDAYRKIWLRAPLRVRRRIAKDVAREAKKLPRLEAGADADEDAV